MKGTTRLISLVAAGALALGMTASPAPAVPTWLLPPTPLSDPTIDIIWQQVAVNARGDAMVAWSTLGAGLVQAAWRPAGGSWGQPVDLSEPGHFSQEAYVGVDDAGNATVIWRDTAGAGDLINARTRSYEGTWGATTPLSTSGNEAYHARLAVGADGSAVVAWYETVPATSQYSIHAGFRPAGGAWESAKLVSSATPAFDPEVAIGGGLVAVAWRDRSTGTNTTTAAIRSVSSGSWNPPQPLSTAGSDAQDPGVVVDGAGLVTVIWRRYDGVRTLVETRTRDGSGIWGDTKEVSVPATNNSGPSIAVDSAGNLSAAWLQSGPHKTVMASTLVPGGSWTTPEPLSDPAQDTWNPEVAARLPGSTVVSWSSVGDADTEDTVWASRRTGGGSFGPAALVAPKALEDSTIPDVSMDSHGDAVVASRRYNGTKYVAAVTPLDAAAPEVDLVVPATATAGKSRGFSAVVADTWSSVVSVVWSFGDGGTASVATASHTFNKAGSYIVTLVATDAVGNTTTRTATVKVQAPRPVLRVFKLTDGRIGPGQKTKLKVRLNTKATLKLVLKGKAKGVKVVVKKKLPRGTTRIALTTRIAGKVLVPDTYVLTGSATNATGTSTKKRATLTIVR